MIWDHKRLYSLRIKIVLIEWETGGLIIYFMCWYTVIKLLLQVILYYHLVYYCMINVNCIFTSDDVNTYWLGCVVIMIYSWCPPISITAVEFIVIKLLYTHVVYEFLHWLLIHHMNSVKCRLIVSYGWAYDSIRTRPLIFIHAV